MWHFHACHVAGEKELALVVEQFAGEVVQRLVTMTIGPPGLHIQIVPVDTRGQLLGGHLSQFAPLQLQAHFRSADHLTPDL